MSERRPSWQKSRRKRRVEEVQAQAGMNLPEPSAIEPLAKRDVEGMKRALGAAGAGAFYIGVDYRAGRGRLGLWEVCVWRVDERRVTVNLRPGQASVAVSPQPDPYYKVLKERPVAEGGQKPPSERLAQKLIDFKEKQQDG